MVATTRGRKGVPSTDGDQKDNVARTSDGRRHILGLTQAIREKAFQSTSPSSEQKLRASTHQSKRENGIDTSTQKTTSKLTIEERLKSLLSSDTEGVEDKRARPRTLPCSAPPPYRSNPPGPRANSPQRREMNPFAHPNKPFQAEGRVLIRTGRPEYEISNRASQVLQHAVPSPHARNPAVVVQRRCTSAVPPSFHDDNWNQIQEHPPFHSSPAVGAPVPSPGGRALDSRAAAINRKTSPNSPSYELQQPRLLIAPGRRQVRSANPSGRPTPAMRRSLCFENANAQEAPQLVLNRPFNSSDASMHLVVSDYAKPPSRPYTEYHKFHQSPPQLNNLNVKHHAQVASQPPRHDSDARKTFLPAGTQSPVDSKPPKMPVAGKPPKTAQADLSRTASCNRSPPAAAKLNLITNGYPANARAYYPQHSFRRAVHHSPSSDSLIEPPFDVKRSSSCKDDKQPLGDDRDFRKSDDRDSGAVLEPDASVFDFDSSILSEETNEQKSESQSPSKNTYAPRPLPKEAWSHSSTPVLPPLSSDNEDEGNVNCDATAKRGVSSPPPRMGAKKVDQLSLNVATSDSKTGGAAELSPTESALSVVKAKQLEQRNQTKIVSSKLQRGTSAVRRGLHSKNLSGDERSRRKHRHRCYHDDSDATDWSQQQDRYRVSSRRRVHPAYYSRTSSVTIDASEIGETSSVRSVTTTSVCSGALRKSSRRRRSYFNSAVGAERYSREIRSVNRRFSRLEAHVVTLARSLAQLSSELRHQSVTSREIDHIRQQMHELRANQLTAIDHQKQMKNAVVAKSETKQPKFSKLAKFFGEQPPLLHLFLKQLGYEKYIKNFECERIGMMELPYMDEKRLHDIGIPLGPRLRILKEAQKSSYV